MSLLLIVDITFIVDLGVFDVAQKPFERHLLCQTEREPPSPNVDARVTEFAVELWIYGDNYVQYALITRHRSFCYPTSN